MTPQHEDNTERKSSTECIDRVEYVDINNTPGAVGRIVDVFLSLFVSFWSDKKSAPFLSPKPKQRILNGKFLNAFTSFKRLINVL